MMHCPVCLVLEVPSWLYGCPVTFLAEKVPPQKFFAYGIPALIKIYFYTNFRERENFNQKFVAECKLPEDFLYRARICKKATFFYLHSTPLKQCLKSFL
jgi:hypothetical protein